MMMNSLNNNPRRPPRGLRNCNPGNIRRGGNFRYEGECEESSDPHFRQFRSVEWGYRAMFVLLHTYRTRHGCRTLAQMLRRYAPPSENATDLYIRRVSELAGIAADGELDTLSAAVMPHVVSAISEVENGVAANREDVWRGWKLFCGDR